RKPKRRPMLQQAARRSVHSLNNRTAHAMFTKRKPEATAPEVELKVTAVETAAPQPEQRSASNATLMKPSIISEGFELVGDLISTGVVHVEGTVRGKLALSTITIGSKGVVDGTIQCETLHVKGRFSGTAHCRELTLSAGASVDGQVYYSTLAVQRGAKITGELVKK
ncbi:MAG: bactofilin family protein, partial [Rhodospirillaceae bacterium]